MKMKPLGRSGLSVSEICLGSMTWGTQNSEAEGHAQIDRAVAAGVNFIDTAEMYPTTPLSRETTGRTEEIIGTWIAKNPEKRDDMVIATKVVGNGSGTVRDGGPITPEVIRGAVSDSLERLQTDHIDLYQLHWPNRGSYHFRQNWSFDPSHRDVAQVRDDLLTTLTALDAEVKAGRIRHVGVSNDTVWGMMTMLRMAEEAGLPRIESVQNEYSLLYRQFDLDLAEFALAEDVGLICYSPLAAGLLTGKYRGGVTPRGSRADVARADLGGRRTPRAETAVEEYAALAQRHGMSLTQLSIAFALSRPFMTSAIIGATSLEQLDEILSATEMPITAEMVAEIDDIHRDHPWPY
ncbi:MAG: aldo/keto reductase [Rubricella sp.]